MQMFFTFDIHGYQQRKFLVEYLNVHIYIYSKPNNFMLLEGVVVAMQHLGQTVTDANFGWTLKQCSKIITVNQWYAFLWLCLHYISKIFSSYIRTYCCMLLSLSIPCT